MPVFDGGPAFPVYNPAGPTDHLAHAAYTTPGMTLRQWYAGQAMMGYIMAKPTDGLDTFADAAEKAFRAADALLGREASTEKALVVAYHALRSYQNGNASTELAEEIADMIKKIIDIGGNAKL